MEGAENEECRGGKTMGFFNVVADIGPGILGRTVTNVGLNASPRPSPL